MIENQQKHFLDDRLDGEETEGNDEGVVAPTDHAGNEANWKPLDSIR